MIISKHSWHYWVAKEWGARWQDLGECRDSCTYFWYVIKGLFLLTAAVFALLVICIPVAGFVLYSTADFIAWLCYGFTNTWVMIEDGIAVACMLVAGTIVITIAKIVSYLENPYLPPIVERNTKFFEIWSAVKSKTCFQIKYKEVDYD